VHALIDTGARTTLVTRRVAQALGVTAEALQNDPARAGLGVGLGNILFRQHRFAELRVGPLVLHDIEANVADPHLPGVDMLLGADILAGRRVWISAASGRLFIR
jgi:predicted aspartyl protease